MIQFDKIIENRLAQNISIWLVIFIILLGSINSENVIFSVVVILAILIPAIYINNLLILPKVKTNKIVFALLFLANISFFSLISIIIFLESLDTDFEWKMLNLSGVIFLAVVFGSAVKISRDSYALRQKNKEAELKLLKGQLNPHFLFNTLNNLYGLSVMKSDKLPNLMLKLSDLLRYSLYETKEKFVSLEKEISYLENYISLEKIRLEDTVEIQFNTDGNFSNKMIAPMMLVVFVENAFKHIEITEGKTSFVNLSLDIEENNLIFKCQNTFSNNTNNPSILKEKQGGIGLENVKKRLQLIYPNKYNLEIKTIDNEYIVELNLQIS